MTASPFPSSPLRTAASAIRPHWALIAALGLLLLAGLPVLDDYGRASDENPSIILGEASIDYVLGKDDAILGFPYRSYGVAAPMPLAFADRALGLDDSRERSLARRLITRFLFLTGGLFAYLLAVRLFNNKRVALLAALLFLSHPRLYAHSFVNVNDVPFLTAFAIALFLIERAFRRDNLWAFALLGASVGMLTNTRSIGAMLVPAVLAARGLDLLWASGASERKRVLLSAGVFVLAAALALYASWPYLWADPAGRFVEAYASAVRFGLLTEELFRGAPILSTDIPPSYVLTWFSITTPPFALLLGCIGAAVLFIRGVSLRSLALRSARLRFMLLAAACFAAPVASPILFDLTVYNGWRHSYFIWAPFTLLAAFGLHWLISGAFRRRRALAYGAAAVGIGAAAVATALLHPNQQVYFNFIEDRVEPDRLSQRYVLDYWNLSTYELYRHLLHAEPSTLTIQYRPGLAPPMGLLAKPDRERVSLVNSALADFSIRTGRPEEDVEALRVIEVYNNALFALVREQPGENPFPAIYAAALALEPIVRSGFDLYALDRMLIYVKAPCESGDLKGAFFLRFYPASPDNLPEEWRWAGYWETRFRFLERGSLFNGKCVAAFPLPDYAILNVHAYQYYGYPNELYWEDLFPLDAAEHYAAYEAAANGEPDARAAFDLHLNRQARTMTYVKEPCALSDVERKFFLHIAPERVDDLPQNRREHGFDNLDFEYLTQGVVFDRKCVAVLPLPNYAIERIRTGQFERGEDEIWEARLRF